MDVITISSIIQQGLIFRDKSLLYLYCFRILAGVGFVKCPESSQEEQGNFIRLEHNQFVAIQPYRGLVGLRITLECFWTGA